MLPCRAELLYLGDFRYINRFKEFKFKALVL